MGDLRLISFYRQGTGEEKVATGYQDVGKTGFEFINLQRINTGGKTKYQLFSNVSQAMVPMVEAINPHHCIIH